MFKSYRFALSFLGFAAFYTPISQAQDIDLSQIVEAIPTTSIVTGIIKDTTLNEPLGYGSVVLINEENNAQIGLNSDSTGMFRFEKVPPANYKLIAYYVGYDNYEQQIVITEKPQLIDLGTLAMLSGNNTLKEVQIVDFRDLIEERPDGLVYNAERDGTNIGTTADELLRKVPMLTVDLDGNVSMRGSGNIKVFIDGKPSSIIAASVKDVLKQMPSDNVKSVEVITSPGAKYDAEGTAGVINIITKKSIIKGISGMTYVGSNYTFNQDQINGHAGVNLNFRRDKFGVSLNLGAGSWSRESYGFAERVDFPGTPQESIFKQEYTEKMGGPFLWGGMNTDYQIDSLQSVQVGFNLNPGNWKSEKDQNTIFPDQNIDYNRMINNETPRLNYSFNGSYSKKFKSDPKRTLDVLAMYAIGSSNNAYDLVQKNNEDGIENYKEKSENEALNNEFTIQTDYVHPFKKHNQKLELGLKYIHRDVNSDYELSNWNIANNNGNFEIVPSRTNGLDYIQQVASAYGQFSTSLTKALSVVAGLRYEYTDINAAQRDFGGEFKDDYSNLLPSAIFSWDLKNFNKLKISYFQRIQRPSIDYINPYVNYSDPFNIQSGNPELDPELSHNIELGFSSIKGRSTINLSTFYRFTNNAIEAVSAVDENGVNRGTYGNFAENTTLGLNLFGSTRLFDSWMINVNGNLYHKSLKSENLGISNKGFQYDFNIYSNYRIMDGLTAEGFGMYRAKEVMLQGKTSGYYYYSLGLKKSILKGKGDISLSVANIFHPEVKYTVEMEYLNSIYYNESQNYARGIRIGFSYRFGKMTFSSRARQIENDDLKQSDGQQGGGQDQMR